MFKNIDCGFSTFFARAFARKSRKRRYLRGFLAPRLLLRAPPHLHPLCVAAARAPRAQEHAEKCIDAGTFAEKSDTLLKAIHSQTRSLCNYRILGVQKNFAKAVVFDLPFDRIGMRIAFWFLVRKTVRIPWLAQVQNIGIYIAVGLLLQKAW